MSEGATELRTDLSKPQLRVLEVLLGAKGPISRVEVARRYPATDVRVGKLVGRYADDPVKRRAFEATQDGGYRLSLLSHGYVQETKVDVDGVIETVLSITTKGREAYVRESK